MTRRSYWKKAAEPVETIRRWVAPLIFTTGDEDKDARDPRHLHPNGTYAPPGPTVQIRDFDDWPAA
jgi:hypothetical protein